MYISYFSYLPRSFMFPQKVVKDSHEFVSCCSSRDPGHIAVDGGQLRPLLGAPVSVLVSGLCCLD